MADEVEVVEQKERVDPGIDAREDIGKDEAYTLNLKRVCEEFLHESLTDIRRARDHYESLFTDTRDLANRIKQNAVTTDKQIDGLTISRVGAVLNSDNFRGYTAGTSSGIVDAKILDQDQLGHDRAWNLDEQINAAQTAAALASVMVEHLAGVTISKDAIYQLIVAAIANTQTKTATA